jgi:ABC-type uncharacterized transport system permease subunit
MLMDNSNLMLSPLTFAFLVAAIFRELPWAPIAVLKRVWNVYYHQQPGTC